MKKKVVKIIGLAIFAIIIICAIFNIYKWVVSGKQNIKISTANKAYSNSNLYVSIVAEENNVDLETKSNVKLLDSKGRKVKNVKVSYQDNTAIISVPDVEPGNYLLEANVSSKVGKDKIQRQIYISNQNTERATITFDKGIYKPGDTVNFRALLTNKENDEPLKRDTKICIYDGNNNKVYDENVKTSDYGIVSGSFGLANEVNSGIYKLSIKTDTSETTNEFKVNPYITPKYEVKITTDKQNYLVNDIATINIESKYFFGKQASGTKYTVYIDGKKYQDITAGNDGKASVRYKIEQAKEYNIKVEAVDSSNYFAEEKSSFTVGTDLFEVELLSEYDSLVAGRKNDIYVFTNTAGGKPIKTYLTITNNRITKQVATDENGIGKFSIDVDSLTNSNYNKMETFYITAQNMNGDKVQKTIQLNVQNKSLLLSTDKVKYNQGDNIKLRVSSLSENAKNIYFFKNDKLIKMINTDSEDTTVNLDNNYGLIDVYVTETKNARYYTYSRYNNVNSFKKTIFIKPNKELNIDIKTDKEEYKPGDNISISFETTDESKNKIEAAMLVSMLDNSILNLADNDLSIDNIKLALQDIKFSNDLDAATLYSCIINDNQEQTMMALLLKQKNKDITVSESIVRNYEERVKAQAISIILLAFIVITILVYLCVKFKKFRKFMKHFVNTAMLIFIVCMVELCIIEEYFWNFDYNLWIFIFTVVVCIAVYIAWISKINKNLFRTSISIIITMLLVTGITVLYEMFTIPGYAFLILLGVIILVLAILSKINEKKKFKFFRYITKEILYILKYIGVATISLFVGLLVQKITDIDAIIIPISIIGVYLLNYFFNRIGKEEDKEKKEITLLNVVVIIFAVIGIITWGFFIIYGMQDRIIYHSSLDVQENSVYRSNTPIDDFIMEDTAKSTSKGNSILNLFNGSTNTKSKVQEDSLDERITTTITNEEETKITENDNIRNVFLESMCFVPELISTNGNANLNLKLSDNITTWTIQTVGNTKDGRIGYSKLDTVKVFKDFFVDFELPKNLVETDEVSIPVTVYNYTNEPLNASLKVKEDDWFSKKNNNITVNVAAQSSKMVYIPITIIKIGNYKFRVECVAGEQTDIVEKELTISPKGYKIEKVVSSGILDEDITEDLLMLENIVPNTASAKVKIYASEMAQTIEGMENIFRMPTGCFEQISSSLYPNILALKYLEEKGIVNEEIKQKALSYISSGYQKLLSYEVQGEAGGYSLYGESPAETVLTAYGLMEMTDLKDVYKVDENVVKKMTDFLYKKQNLNGSFTITGYHLGGANSDEELALNAYITWALSEADSKNEKLTKSIEYLKGKIDKVNDNYTLALIANVLANVNDKEIDNVIKRLVANINVNNNYAYITSDIVDYYGSRSTCQNLQTVALTSIALSKTSKNSMVNKQLINYIISQKDTYGTWSSTQATILALKAINSYSEKRKLDNQTIAVKVNEDEKKIEIKDNPLEVYELTFNNLSKENKLNIDIEKGSAYYEVVEEYYLPYEAIDTKSDKIDVMVDTNSRLSVNEILDAKIKVINKDKASIYNGMVTISIPQGFVVKEESLMLLQEKGIIEKYETSYNNINLYLRNFEVNQIIDLNIQFRASYPVNITGLSARAYDYYNPEVQGRCMPRTIVVK